MKDNNTLWFLLTRGCSYVYDYGISEHVYCNYLTGCNCDKVISTDLSMTTFNKWKYTVSILLHQNVNMMDRQEV